MHPSSLNDPVVVDALPIRLVVAGSHAAAIRRFIEGIVGWQPVEHAAAPLVPPVLTVCDVAGSVQAGHDLPLLLLVAGDDLPAEAALAGGRAAAVAAWPAERDRLVQVAARLAAARAVASSGARELRVGGAAGGVGTTTVALALGGLTAWRGCQTVVLTHRPAPIPTGRTVDPDDLAGVDAWQAAIRLPGIPGLKALQLPVPVPAGPVNPGAAGLVVRDLGVDVDADVLVVRRDRAGLAALERSPTAVAVVTDCGPAPLAALRAAAAGRRVVAVGWSERVARAGLAGAVPARLPGRWLHSLAAVLAGGLR